ncbi:unnamed protein product [Vitrella brassicaformis CCMP3155]|uniref:K Homology domain-containing protein n=1 Tax=Vitrella brassicaformis (strain CCMP3155) TaxID=1169540 RepID=A0A0G4GA12_VITBC|nr:unnamed protein product [Vitrella brassicaformis CCMP3155]|eukprot:CEM25785.1 unnamed protein product [Vitrella brassicaformis CCMP3155]
MSVKKDPLTDWAWASGMYPSPWCLQQSVPLCAAVFAARVEPVNGATGAELEVRLQQVAAAFAPLLHHKKDLLDIHIKQCVCKCVRQQQNGGGDDSPCAGSSCSKSRKKPKKPKNDKTTKVKIPPLTKTTLFKPTPNKTDAAPLRHHRTTSCVKLADASVTATDVGDSEKDARTPQLGTPKDHHTPSPPVGPAPPAHQQQPPPPSHHTHTRRVVEVGPPRSRLPAPAGEWSERTGRLGQAGPSARVPRVGMHIGKGGCHVKKVQHDFGVKIHVMPPRDGKARVQMFGPSQDKLEAARAAFEFVREEVIISKDELIWLNPPRDTPKKQQQYYHGRGRLSGREVAEATGVSSMTSLPAFYIRSADDDFEPHCLAT